MAFPFCLSFFIICFTFKKGGEGDGWTIIVIVETDCITFICFFLFLFFYFTLIEREELAIIDERRTLRKQLNPDCVCCNNSENTN